MKQIIIDCSDISDKLNHSAMTLYTVYKLVF